MAKKNQDRRWRLVIRPEWFTLFTFLDDESAGMLIKYMIKYWDDRDPGELPENVYTTFMSIVDGLDDDKAHYSCVLESRVMAAEKRKATFAEKKRQSITMVKT